MKYQLHDGHFMQLHAGPVVGEHGGGLSVVCLHHPNRKMPVVRRPFTVSAMET